MLTVKTLHGQVTKDTTIVYISPKMWRADSADLSTKQLCSIWTANSRPWQWWPWYFPYPQSKLDMLLL